MIGSPPWIFRTVSGSGLFGHFAPPGLAPAARFLALGGRQQPRARDGLDAAHVRLAAADRRDRLHDELGGVEARGVRLLGGALLEPFLLLATLLEAVLLDLAQLGEHDVA